MRLQRAHKEAKRIGAKRNNYIRSEEWEQLSDARTAILIHNLKNKSA